FKGKDDIISAAVTEATLHIAKALAPILADPDPGPPAEFVWKLIEAWTHYSHNRVRAAADRHRKPLAIDGWPSAQTDPKLRATMAAGHRSFRDQCTPIIRRWQDQGMVDRLVDPGALAQVILSLCLGFVAQQALIADADPDAHAMGVNALMTSITAATPQR